LANGASAADAPRDAIFRARVVEILAEEKKALPDGGESVQQDLKLVGLEGDLIGTEVVSKGIGEVATVAKEDYRPGDLVLVAQSFGPDEEPVYYVVDRVRSGALAWLAGIFVVLLLAVGRWKGLRSLLALGFSFAVIVKYIIPQILSGVSPLFVTFIGSMAILLAIIYVTEGFKPRAHLSVIAIFIGLLLTIALSYLFVAWASLSGAASEDVLFLFDLPGGTINLQGLLLAGIIIGALGVLDDIVISQVATVEELKRTDPGLGSKELFRRAYSVGVSHIASMTNTLFLAYAGAALPLLILFASGESAVQSWGQAINTELVATEIVRTLAGSIGLVLVVPIATAIAAWRFGRR
jgi:uncharacterized membrane protein